MNSLLLLKLAVPPLTLRVSAVAFALNGRTARDVEGLRRYRGGKVMLAPEIVVVPLTE